MAALATWLIIVGFVLLALGIILRTVIMMSSSDATPPGPVLHGRELRVQYDRLFPKSSIPVTTRAVLICGAILVLVGISVEIWR
jgi:uncharacterized membrane protein